MVVKIWGQGLGMWPKGSVLAYHLQVHGLTPSTTKKKKFEFCSHTAWEHTKASSHWVPVAHTCNPSYSGGRDQEDHSSKPALANCSMRPYLEKTLCKKGLVEWLKV
jgi:hypothetical protein